MQSHTAHDHAHHHDHADNHGQVHAHARIKAPIAAAQFAPGFSLLRLSAFERLAGAAGLSAIIWAGVYWALR